MFDVNGILGALQNDPNARRTAMAGGGGLAAGLAASMLMGKSGRKMMGKAAKYGAVAALGGLAYHAWNKSQQRKAGQGGAAQAAGASAASAAPSTSVPAIDADYEAAPAASAFLPAPNDEAAQDKLGQALVRAMIAAAKADGKIDADEKARIFERLNAMDLDADAKAFVFDELSAPLDINAVVAGADTPEHAAEIYAASLVAIEADTPAETAYLQMLAARLELDPIFVEEVHNAAGAAAPA
ncbi:MAG: tellurite resistance TerB family protein [Pseudomonadota bacterium]